MRKKALTPEQVQCALFLHRCEYLNPLEIAEKIGCKESVIEELLDRLERKPGQASETSRQSAKRVVVDPLLSARLIPISEARDCLPPARRMGPGRRFTKAEVEAIRAAIRAGKRMVDIRAQFHCTLDPLLRMRKTMGLYRDWRRKPQVTDDVKARAIALLPTHSVRQIQELLGLSCRRVRAIASAVGWSAKMRTSGRGRRLTEELKKQIIQALRSGVPKVQIKREFKVSLDTVQQLRRRLGDVHDLRKDHKLTAGQVDEIRAALDSHSMTWKQLAKAYGVGLSTIGSIHRGEKGYGINGPTKTHAGTKIENRCLEPSRRQATKNSGATPAQCTPGPSLPTRVRFADAEQRASASACG